MLFIVYSNNLNICNAFEATLIFNLNQNYPGEEQEPKYNELSNKLINAVGVARFSFTQRERERERG